MWRVSIGLFNYLVLINWFYCRFLNFQIGSSLYFGFGRDLGTFLGCDFFLLCSLGFCIGRGDFRNFAIF